MTRKVEFWMHPDGRWRSLVVDLRSPQMVEFGLGRTWVASPTSHLEVLADPVLAHAGVMPNGSRSDWFRAIPSPAALGEDDLRPEDLKAKMKRARDSAFKAGFVGISFWLIDGSVRLTATDWSSR